MATADDVHVLVFLSLIERKRRIQPIEEKRRVGSSPLQLKSL
jgi:hypothetical protein